MIIVVMIMNCVHHDWSWPIRNNGCVQPHSYCFIPALECGERRKARTRLLALDSRNAELAGGFPSNPILSGPRQTKYIWEKASEYFESYHDIFKLRYDNE